MHYLYSKSNVAYKDKLVGQFSRTASVRRAIFNKSEMHATDYNESLKSMDDWCIREYKNRLVRGVVNDIFDERNFCTYILAQSLREDTWCIDIVCVTMHEQVILSRYDQLESISSYIHVT
jgi:hypothetical protein